MPEMPQASEASHTEKCFRFGFAAPLPAASTATHHQTLRERQTFQKKFQKNHFSIAYFNSMAEKTLTYLLLGDGAFAVLRNAVLIES